MGEPLKKYRVFVTCPAVVTWEGDIEAPSPHGAAQVAEQFCQKTQPWQSTCAVGRPPEAVMVEEKKVG